MLIFIIWRLGIRQFSYSPYRAGPAAPRLVRLSTIAAFLTCYCPRSPFGSQVSHQTQEHPSEFLPAEPGIQRSASWRTYTTSRAGNNRRRISRESVVATTRSTTSGGNALVNAPTDTRSGNHPSGDTPADPSCATP
jgi:hypothetical protein